MPLVRAVTDERDALLTFLAEQRAGVVNALRGLTDEQAATRTTASELSLATILKHIVRVERRWSEVAIAGRTDTGLFPDYDRAAEFRFEDGDSVKVLLAEYEDVARRTEEIVAATPDLGATATLREPRTVRWVLLHLIQETGRHAGHADIIRESIDGASAHELAADAG